MSGNGERAFHILSPGVIDQSCHLFKIYLLSARYCARSQGWKDGYDRRCSCPRRACRAARETDIKRILYFLHSQVLFPHNFSKVGNFLQLTVYI